MTNADISAALEYHNRTKHSYHSVRANLHDLDWDNRPRSFKVYSTLAPIPLPKPTEPLPLAALNALAAPAALTAEDVTSTQVHIPDLATLARILFLSNGVHRFRRYDGVEYTFRTASCTGALYHIEIYLACGDLPGLSAGVYHYGAHDHALRRLRKGDYRAHIVHAASREPAVAHAPALFICTDTFWRNAWKYQEREYRHMGWDSGVILANLLATTAALQLPARIVAGFADDAINQLLDLDTNKEVAVSIVALGRAESALPAATDLAPLSLETAPLSEYEIDYPAIHKVHAASSLMIEEVAGWRGQPPQNPLPPAHGKLFPLAETERVDDPIDAVILRRGSSREFTQTPITFAQLSTILLASTRGVPADFLDPFGASLNDLYLIVNDVEGLPAGSYVYHRGRQVLEQLRVGEFRNRAGYLGLEQELARDASVNIYYLADLPLVLERFGNRGYRAAQIEAGILGGKVYLAAYALGLGATGLTFYDDDVVTFFSPHAAGKAIMFLMLVGKTSPKVRRTRT